MPRMSKLGPIVIVSVAWALSAQAALATSLPSKTGAFAIQPARRQVVANPGIALTPTAVSNTTSSPYAVTVFPALLTQNITGAFDFSTSPQNLYDSKIVLSTSADRFTLEPGQVRQVGLRWNMLPAGQRAVAVGVVFQGIPQGQTSTVHVIARLLSVNFLRLPGAAVTSGMFTGLYAQQFAPHALRLLARIKNTGQTFTAPTRGELEVRDSSGRVMYRSPWAGEPMLPGAQVDFPIDVKQQLPAGHYSATVTMDFGGVRSRSTSIALVGANELPTPGIAVRGFNASGSVGSPAKLVATVASDGTAPASVTLHLFLGAAGSVPGNAALASDQVAYRALGPGSVIQLSHSLGHPLRKGSYRAILTWSDPTGAPHMLEADFTALPSRSSLQKFWSLLSDNAGVLIGLVILALLLGVAWFIARMRRRQRRVEAELAAARAQLESQVAPPTKVPVFAGAPAPERSELEDAGEWTLPATPPAPRQINGRRLGLAAGAMALGAAAARQAHTRLRRR